MNQQQILKYIQNPTALTEIPGNELEALTEEYPYCAITRLLYTKALYENKSVDFQSVVKKTAAYISDKSALYNLINDKLHFDSDISSIEKNISSKNTLIEEIKNAGLAQARGSRKNIDNLITKLAALLTGKLADIDSVKSRLIQLEELIEKRKREISQSYLSKREILLKNLNSEHIYGIADKEINTKYTSDEKHEEINAFNLIDKFLIEQPSITMPERDDAEIIDMSEESTIDNDEFISETLAKIHIKQGNIKKAIKIYERLSLIFPEKSSYFANLILEINKENNTN